MEEFCVKLLFVSDSFKGSLTSEETVELLDKAARKVFGACETQGFSVADGGEGFVDAVIKACDGERIYREVHGPLGETVKAYYGAVGDTAIIEMAQASGLTLVRPEDRDPRLTTTYGTGELIMDAVSRGYKSIHIAIGGSATNDGGMGFAKAIGIRFLDTAGTELSGRGADLGLVDRIDMSGLDPRLSEVDFTVMCDVQNPLCGPDGATYTFGKQKGGTPEILDELERGMQHYCNVITKEFGADPQAVPGTGAAGGLGVALFVFLKAKMQSGIESMLELIEFDKKLDGVDLVVTGEGQTDWQSCFGKVMQGVGDHCKNKGIPAVALCGSLGEGYDQIYEHGISSLMTTVDSPMTVEHAMSEARDLYLKAAIRMFRFIKTGMEIRN